MSDSGGGIGPLVRSYLHYGGMASSFYKQYLAAKKIKDQYESEVIGLLQRNGMEKATIQINGGTLHVTERREANPLSLTKIEELLHGYARQRGGRDETAEIMTFIRANRGTSIIKGLKQNGLQSTGQPPSATPQLQ